jgi:hypothetical protein
VTARPLEQESGPRRTGLSRLRAVRAARTVAPHPTPRAAPSEHPANASGERWEPMTMWTLLRAVRRRWYVSTVGLIGTVVGVYLAATTPGIYYQQADVVFFAPDIPQGANAYQLVPDSLISAAGLVGRQVHEEMDGPQPVSSTVTILDIGIRDGVRVRIPNSGGQWNISFHQPVLDVEIVGNSPERVRARMSATVSRIQQVLRDGQLAAGASSRQLITAALNPSTPPVLYRRGDRARATASALALGLGLTLTSAALVERTVGGLQESARRRRLRRSRDRGPTSTG